MDFHATSSLNPKDYIDLDRIIRNTGYEPFFFDDDSYDSDTLFSYPLYYTAHVGDELVSFIGLLPLSDCSVEITGVTALAHRHKGYFSKLLQMALAQLSNAGIPSIYCDTELTYDFVTCQKSHSELEMELQHKNYNASISDPSCSITEYTYELDSAEEELVYLLCDDSTPIGLCKITFSADSHFATLHHVKIRKKFRGLGYGKRLLNGALSHFYIDHEDNRSICLHVTSTNYAAVHLYESLGFSIIDSLDYYSLQQ